MKIMKRILEIIRNNPFLTDIINNFSQTISSVGEDEDGSGGSNSPFLLHPMTILAIMIGGFGIVSPIDGEDDEDSPLSAEEYETLMHIIWNNNIEPFSNFSSQVLSEEDFNTFVRKNNNSICSICLDSNTENVVVELPCKHYFHEECIGKWLMERVNTCPLCKSIVLRI